MFTQVAAYSSCGLLKVRATDPAHQRVTVSGFQFGNTMGFIGRHDSGAASFPLAGCGLAGLHGLQFATSKVFRIA